MRYVKVFAGLGELMAIDLPTFVLSVIGAGGGSAAVTLGVARAFGSKWLELQFNSRLEALKHDYQTEVERLRFKIAGLLDRSAKLNQREFEVIPDIWAKIDAAHRHVITMIAVFRQRADLSRMGDAQLEEFISASDLQDWQKDELRNIPLPFNRNTYYSEAMSWIELHRASQAVQAVNEAVSKGGIYIHPETYKEIDEFATFLSEALWEWRMGRQMRANGDAITKPKEDDAVQRYRTDGNARFQKLGDYLRSRYWEAPSLP